jgi:lysozyme
LNRRWQFSFVAFLVAAVSIGGAYLYFRDEPDRSRFSNRGIDVSRHQGTIDWRKVVVDDVAFAYLKASEGGDHRDREFVRNLAEATKIGLRVGAYHFFTFCRLAIDQAKNFVDAVPPGATQLPPVVDPGRGWLGDLAVPAAGRVAGIEGNVDLNVLSGPLDRLINP